MGNCLITKLKAVVNNPNLPVLETMQQFTLDAIARGGNMELSDDKKWALNHFFYEIGAIDNNTLWGKFRTLLLPIIGSDKSHIGLDYKDTNCYLSLNANVGDTGGELYSLVNDNTLTFNKTINNTWNLFTNLLVCTIDGYEMVKGTASYLTNIVRNNSLRMDRTMGSYVATTQYIAAVLASNPSSYGKIEAKTANNNVAISMVNFNKNQVTLYLKDTEGNLMTGSTSGSVTSEEQITPSMYMLQMSTDVRYGIIADFAEELTKAESLKVLNAVEALRNAFKS